MIHSSVKRWGNSPAVRIPATLILALMSCNSSGATVPFL
ncbi:hypothetical protein ACUN9W_03085, partial [Escherichia coli]